MNNRDPPKLLNNEKRIEQMKRIEKKEWFFFIPVSLCNQQTNVADGGSPKVQANFCLLDHGPIVPMLKYHPHHMLVLNLRKKRKKKKD